MSGCAAVATVAAAHPALVAAVVDFVPIALAIAGVGFIGIAGVAGHHSESFEPGTLGSFLQEKQAAMAALSTNAMQEQREVGMGTLLQTTRLIVRTRIAFRDQLTGKLDALDAPAKSAVASIETAVRGLEAAPPAVKEVGERAQAVADQLKVPAQFPQVRSYGPYYLFSSLPFQTITVRGDFPREYRDGMLPELRIEERTYKAIAYDSQGVSFSLPAHALGGAHSQAIAWKKADLTVPWDQPRFDTLARAGHENFLVLGLLPHSPGRVTIEHRLSNVRREEETRISDAFSLSPEFGESEQVACLSLTPKEIAEGWRLKSGSGSLVAVAPAASADAWKDLGRQSEDERSVCWRIRLAPAALAQSFAWKISATVSRESVDARTQSETFDLAWGGSRSFRYPPGSWKVRYGKYDGTETEFTSTDRTSPLFRVEADARSVRVSAYPF
jgi:hypothetical protein